HRSAAQADRRGRGQALPRDHPDHIPSDLPRHRADGHPGLRVRHDAGARARPNPRPGCAPHRRQHRGAETPRCPRAPPAGGEMMQLVDHLNRASVAKHFDAYLDVDWDAPEHTIDPEDPRWQLSEDDPIGRSAWYRGLAPATRARLGLHVAASAMKVGW